MPCHVCPPLHPTPHPHPAHAQLRHQHHRQRHPRLCVAQGHPGAGRGRLIPHPAGCQAVARAAALVQAQRRGPPGGGAGPGGARGGGRTVRSRGVRMQPCACGFVCAARQRSELPRWPSSSSTSRRQRRARARGVRVVLQWHGASVTWCRSGLAAVVLLPRCLRAAAGADVHVLSNTTATARAAARCPCRWPLRARCCRAAVRRSAAR